MRHTSLNKILRLEATSTTFINHLNYLSMSKFLLTGNWEFPAFPLLDKFLGDGIACKDGGVRCEVIKIEENDGKQAVNARELHQKLGSKQDFSTWIKNRIEKYGFVESQDFEVFHKIMENLNGGRSRIEYALSLDMAKELCMVENNDAGRKIRKYFIDMENEARKLMVQQVAIPSYQEQDPIKRATRWIEEEKVRQSLMLENKEQKKQLEENSKEIVALSSTITQMQPKVTYYDTILANKSTVKVSQIAQDYGMSAQAFNKLLWEHKLQRKVGKQWILYRQFLDKGYVHSEPIPIEHHDGSQTYNYLTVWTQKGRIFLYDFLKRFDVLPMIERSDSGEAHK